MRSAERNACGNIAARLDLQRNGLLHAEKLCLPLRNEGSEGEQPFRKSLKASLRLIVGALQVNEDEEVQRLLRQLSTELRTNG